MNFSCFSGTLVHRLYPSSPVSAGCFSVHMGQIWRPLSQGSRAHALAGRVRLAQLGSGVTPNSVYAAQGVEVAWLKYGAWPRVMTRLRVVTGCRAHLQRKSTTPGRGVFCLIWLGAWSVEGLWGRRVALAPVLTAGPW